MRARYLFFSLCLASYFVVACDDDADSHPHGTAGSTGTAGSSSNPSDAGAPGGTDVAGQPATAGAGPGLGEGGAGGEPPQGFTDFVHELVNQQTQDTNSPASVNGRQFRDATDEHGHYLVPATDFDDLF
jgi:hypothetical protein